MWHTNQQFASLKNEEHYKANSYMTKIEMDIYFIKLNFYFFVVLA
jgi:hypothetical protein